MEFLGIGPLEFLVIVIIALIVVGPERLPEIARAIGKTLRDLRAMSEGLTAEWQQELNLASDIEEGKKGLQQALLEPFKEAQADFQRTFTVPLQEAQTDLQRALTAPLTSPSVATVEPSSPKEPTEPSSSASTAELPSTDGKAAPSSSKEPAGQLQNIEKSDASNDHTGDANA